MDKQTKPNLPNLEEIVESLYDFSNSELRRLALECLLITDGPDKKEEG
jgi:hypothetical protein